MTERLLSRVTSEHDGHRKSRKELATPTDVAAVLLAWEGESDVTLTVEPEGLDEHLLIAVDGSVAFLGLERSGDLLQFRPTDSKDGTHPFVIGGQPTDIEAKYVVDIATASEVVGEYLATGDVSAAGWWETQ
jgi:hypothetical protein